MLGQYLGPTPLICPENIADLCRLSFKYLCTFIFVFTIWHGSLIGLKLSIELIENGLGFLSPGAKSVFSQSMEELKILKYEKGAKGIYFQDSTFTINRKYIENIFNRMIY